MKTLAVGVILAAAVGCVTLKPIGPLAGPPEAAAREATTPEPIVRPAPKPTPPAVYVTPGEVTPITAEEAAKRLGQEIDADRRAMDAMPRPAEVSVVK